MRLMKHAQHKEGDTQLQRPQVLRSMVQEDPRAVGRNALWRFLDVANALTLLGLAASFACSVLAAERRIAPAVVALMVAGVCDLLDGFVARRLRCCEERRRFGAHLDSVVDACSFGLAPALLLYGAGLRSIPELVLLGLFAACAVWRLAFFETVGMSIEGGERYYHGLPTTFVALVLPLALLSGFAGPVPQRIVANVATGALATMMVSPFRLRKPGGLWYGIFLVLACGLIGVYIYFGDTICAG